MAEEIINSPFDRVPVCSCDPGIGDPPTRKMMLECKLRGGPCREAPKPESEVMPDEAPTWCREETGRCTLNGECYECGAIEGQKCLRPRVTPGRET